MVLSFMVERKIIHIHQIMERTIKIILWFQQQPMPRGDMLVDESFGFTAPHLANEFKYTSTPDAARGDGSNGNFGAHGFNEKVCP